jgi:hypothetical protein
VKRRTHRAVAVVNPAACAQTEGRGGKRSRPVLSVEACRRLLPEECLLSDADVVRLRDQLYAFAEMVLERNEVRSSRL